MHIPGKYHDNQSNSYQLPTINGDQDLSFSTDVTHESRMEPRIFPPKILYLFNKIFSFYYSTHCYPFAWDEKKQTLALGHTQTKRIWSILFTILTTSFMLFELLQIIFLLRSETPPQVMDFYWVSCYCWGYGASAEGLVNAMWKGEEWIQFFRQLINFDTKFNGVVKKYWKH